MSNTFHHFSVFRLSYIFALIFCTITKTTSAASECECESKDLYVIRSKGTNGLVLDATDPQHLKVQHFTGSETQLWKFQPTGKPGLYFIINEYHRKYLDFVKREDNHLHPIVSDKNEEDEMQQMWNYGVKGHIASAVNGKNVDIDSANYTPGNRVILWKGNGCICQEYILQKKV